MDNWTGTGTIESAGDDERLVLNTGEYMNGEVVITGVSKVQLLQNVYKSASTVTLKYRHGATEVACLAADWNTYTGIFTSLGYVQVRVEATA